MHAQLHTSHRIIIIINYHAIYFGCTSSPSYFIVRMRVAGKMSGDEQGEEAMAVEVSGAALQQDAKGSRKARHEMPW